MTGIPFSFPQLGNNQVIANQPPVQYPDLGAAFLHAMLAAQSEKGANSRTSAQVDIRKQELALEAAKEKTRQEELRTQGMGIQALIAKLSGAQDAQAQAHERAMTPMPITGQPLIQPSTGQPLSPAQQTPSAAPVIGTPGGQPQDPYAALGDVTKGMDPASVVGFLKEVHPLFQDAAKRAANARADAEQRRILDTLPADKRDGTERLLLLAKGGANLPASAQKAIAPELFPDNESVDPAQVNAFTAMFRTGAFTAGQAALQTGLPLAKGIDPSVKYVPPANPLSKLFGGARAAQASNLVTEMTFSNAAINAYEDAHPDGLDFMAQMKKDNTGSGVLAGIKRSIANGLVKGDDQAAITAMVDFAQGWAHLTSGVRISDDQFNRILHNTTKERGDDAATVTYKRNMRAVMVQGGQDISKGIRSPTQVIDGALQLPWTKDQKQMLRKMKTEAAKYERQLKAGTAPVPISGEPPSDLNAAQDQIDQLKAILAAQPVPDP